MCTFTVCALTAIMPCYSSYSRSRCCSSFTRSNSESSRWPLSALTVVTFWRRSGPLWGDPIAVLQMWCEQPLFFEGQGTDTWFCSGSSFTAFSAWGSLITTGSKAHICCPSGAAGQLFLPWKTSFCPGLFDLWCSAGGVGVTLVKPKDFLPPLLL